MIGNLTFKYSQTFECAKHKKYNPEVVRKLIRAYHLSLPI